MPHVRCQLEKGFCHINHNALGLTCETDGKEQIQRKRLRTLTPRDSDRHVYGIALTFSPDVEQEHVARLDTPLGILAACLFSGSRVKGHGRGLRGT